MDAAVLQHGDYRAVLSTVGGSLRRLTHRGRDLVRPWPADGVRPAFRGAVLAPWPNRLPEGRWAWHGAEQVVPITEPQLHTALHGLLAWVEWQPGDVRADRVTLRARICPQPGYPFDVEVSVDWRVSARGLDAELLAVNRGGTPAPFGAGFHPYLQAHDGVVDDCTLHLPAATRYEVDERMRLLGEPVAPPPDADFREARRIGTTRLDHCYGGLAFTDGWCEAALVDPRGDGATLGLSAATPWLQAHTSDHDPDPEHYRRAVALEPMTCPPQALASGRDLVVLDPGAALSLPWRVAAV